MPGPKSRKDSEGDRNKGAKAAKGAEGPTGTTDIDSDSELEHASGSGYTHNGSTIAGRQRLRRRPRQGGRRPRRGGVVGSAGRVPEVALGFRMSPVLLSIFRFSREFSVFGGNHLVGSMALKQVQRLVTDGKEAMARTKIGCLHQVRNTLASSMDQELSGSVPRTMKFSPDKCTGPTRKGQPGFGYKGAGKDSRTRSWIERLRKGTTERTTREGRAQVVENIGTVPPVSVFQTCSV